MKPLTRTLHPELLPMLDCPHYDRCSAPVCPLDPRCDERERKDGERQCRLSRAQRKEIGAGLPWRGLWPRELAGVRQWERKAATARTQKVRQLAIGREKAAVTNALGIDLSI